jgi:RNA polymerase sigma factor (sigma-70 family)
VTHAHRSARSDEDLLTQVAQADPDALAEVYDRYSRAAYGLALRVVRDRALAEDAVQETFLAVWRSAGSFAARRGTARAWIMTLAHRRAVDIVRREEVRAAAPLPENDARGETIDLLLGLERQRVRRALDGLPAPQRETLELAYYGGLTQSEIATRLGQPLGTIKTRTFSALARLRTALAEPQPSVVPAEPALAHG